jgi:acetyltransferase-like isoleucine patch superfamily enzyme
MTGAGVRRGRPARHALVECIRQRLSDIVNFKHTARMLCPPVLWDGLRLMKRVSPEADPVAQPAIIGENSAVYARIERRENGKGTIIVGRDCLIHGLLATERDSSIIRIANNVFINIATILDCVNSITIEDDVLIGYYCAVADSDNHSTSYSVRKDDLRKLRQGRYEWDTAKTAPVLICKGAWIGSYAIILKGVRVGVGSVVGAGSVVTKDVPDWTIVAGNPARIVREIPENER